MKSLVLTVFLTLAAGCTLLTRHVARVTAQAVNAYCTAESPEQRAAYRSAFDDALAPAGHHIAIICNGDLQAD